MRSSALEARSSALERLGKLKDINTKTILTQKAPRRCHTKVFYQWDRITKSECDTYQALASHRMRDRIAKSAAKRDRLIYKEQEDLYTAYIVKVALQKMQDENALQKIQKMKDDANYLEAVKENLETNTWAKWLEAQEPRLRRQDAQHFEEKILQAMNPNIPKHQNDPKILEALVKAAWEPLRQNAQKALQAVKEEPEEEEQRVLFKVTGRFKRLRLCDPV